MIIILLLLFYKYVTIFFICYYILIDLFYFLYGVSIFHIHHIYKKKMSKKPDCLTFMYYNNMCYNNNFLYLFISIF